MATTMQGMMKPPENSFWQRLRYLFRPKAHKQFLRQLAKHKAYREFEERMREAGYRPVLSSRPPWFEPIEAMRFEWQESSFIQIKDQRPEFNLAGLWWRDPHEL